jgi:hypothetical protein
VRSATATLLLATGLPLLPWGPEGHRMAAEGSLRTLPPGLRSWYAERKPAFLRAALEPDLWKDQDPAETGRHRIYSETYGGAARVPLTAAEARSQVGAWAFEQSGQLPWVIAERYALLVKAFQSGRPDAVVAASGWLCHYVADAQVPLHTTQNRNGKLTAQKGVHQRWEIGLLRQGVENLPNPRLAVAPADLPGAVSSWVVESHALVPALLAADSATPRHGLQGTPAEEGPWHGQKAVVEQQLRRSAERTGDLLLAAWVEAGRPSPG